MINAISDADKHIATMLVNTAMQLSSDRKSVIAAVMKGSFGTANPAVINQIFDDLSRLSASSET